MSVLLPKQIDVSKIKYSEVKTMKSGAKSVYVNYGNDKLTIQTPSLYLPYGVSPPYSEKKEEEPSDKFIPGSALDVSFRGMDDNSKIKLFYDKLRELEQKIIDDAFINRQAWFKDDFDDNKAFVKKLFSPIVKVDKDPNTGKEIGKHPPTFKAKIASDYKTGEPIIDCKNMENEDVDFNEIFKTLKGARAILIVQLSGLWFAGGKYGCSWKVCSAKFQLAQYQKIAFVKDSDEEDNAVEEEEEDIEPDIPVVSPKKKQVKKKEVIPVEDEDEEEEEVEEEVAEEEAEEEVEEEEEVEPEPEPEPVKPAPKKKAPVKKK